MKMHDKVAFPGATMRVQHIRAGEVIHDETSHNLVTNDGRDAVHARVYTAGSPNAFNYIGLSEDALTEDATATELTTELAGDGLDRTNVGGTTHTVGTNTTTVQNTFTYSAAGPQVVSKAAIFDEAGPAPAGIMLHVAGFNAPRTLYLNDQLVVTFTITLG